MNTQEQQTQNIQSQEQKNRNPEYSKILYTKSSKKINYTFNQKLLS